MKNYLQILLATLFLTACSGGGGGGSGPGPKATPTPTTPDVARQCDDVNAVNQGELATCICASGYAVSTDGYTCEVDATGGTGDPGVTYTYTASFSAYTPSQSATTPCSGVVSTSRTMTCVRNPGSSVVANSFCTADSNPTSTVQSKAGSVTVTSTNPSLTNGSESMTCAVGATSGTRSVTCASDYHVEGATLASQNCYSNTQSCSISNGTGSQTWTGSAYGTCTVSSCNSGYHAESGGCASNTRSCSIANGSGSQTWISGTTYGACTVSSCNSGYVISGNTCVASISAESLIMNNDFGMQIQPSGTLKTWGYNASGQLGVGATANQSSPSTVDLGTGRTAKKVVTNGSSTCAILDNNSLSCWGSNVGNQLGDGTTTTRTTPVNVDLGSGKTAKDIFVGYNAYCSILNDNSLKCWGTNSSGALGTGDTSNVTTPTAINVGASRTVKTVAMTQSSTGNNTTCAILDDNSLSCWGYNAQGQVGNTLTTNRTLPYAVNLGAGRTAKAVYLFTNNGGSDSVSTCAILDDNSLKCWGNNAGGKLGVGDTTNKLTPTSVNVGASRTVKALYNHPNNAMCAILDNNTLSCWGKNNNYQLGNNTTTDSSTPVSVISSSVKEVHINGNTSSTCAVMTAGSLQCWGYNNVGQLGVGNSTMWITEPIAVTFSSRTVKAYVNNADYVSCVILDNDTVQCTGDNAKGSVGTGLTTTSYSSFTSVDLGSGKTAKNIKMYNYSTCVTLNDDKVSCWGNNDKYQMGRGTLDSYYLSPAVINY